MAGTTAPKAGQSAGDADAANAAATGNTEQVTQTGDVTAAEGAQIAKVQEKEQGKSDVVTLAAALHADDPNLKYDDTGVLVNKDGKRIALTADATDPDVGWTVQSALRARDEDGKPKRGASNQGTPYPGGPSGTPDQTVHPDELPDPLAAVRAGLLPQNVGVLNIDPHKFDGKKPMEP
jgi:hypothetical protein